MLVADQCAGRGPTEDDDLGIYSVEAQDRRRTFDAVGKGVEEAMREQDDRLCRTECRMKRGKHLVASANLSLALLDKYLLVIHKQGAGHDLALLGSSGGRHRDLAISKIDALCLAGSGAETDDPPLTVHDRVS